MGSSTGATLSTGSNAYNLTLDGTGNGTYFEWRDVQCDPQLANINIVQGQFGIAGSTTLGNPAYTLNIPSGAYLKFYSDDGYNASINKQVVLNDNGYLQNGSGTSTISGSLSVTNSMGGQYCNFILSGASLTVAGTLTGNGIMFIRSGAGSLIINGDASAFVGGAQDYAGSLFINNNFGSGIVTQPAVTLGGTGTVNGLVDDGGPFFPGGISTGGTFTAAAGLTFEGGASLTMDLTTNLVVGGGTNDLINVTGDLTANGNPIYINPISGTLADGTYVLMNYSGNLINAFGPVQTVSPSRYTLALDTSVNHQVRLIVTGTANNLVWNNAGNNAQWDTQSSYNWTNLTTHTEDQFFAGDTVTFDDTISLDAYPATNINLISTLAPGLITVNSTANNYTFGGAGAISGGASLLKTGASTLTINSTNSFVGPVTLSGGIVRAGNLFALGAPAGTVTITNGASLDLAGYSLSAKSYLVSGAGVGGAGVIMNSGAAIFDNPGSLTNITLLGDATFGGNGRWDFGSRSSGATLSTGGNPYNLTLANASPSTYTWEWYNVAADPALNNINLQAGQWGLAGTNSLGNPLGTITVYPGAELVVYGGSNYSKNCHLMTNGEIQINAGGPSLPITWATTFSTKRPSRAAFVAPARRKTTT